MTPNKRTPVREWVKISATLSVGALLGASLLSLMDTPVSERVGDSAAEPLYWVAPMDPNYRRDQPGKSPMGMDLIPVYEERGEGESAGTVTISPAVINNLGVRTALVERARLAEKINTVGYVQYDENRLIHIHPRVEGWIDKLYIKSAGDPVQEGEPLYSIYSPTLVNAQEELLLARKRDSRALVSAAKERLLALQVPEAEISRLLRRGQVSHTITVYAEQTGVLDNLSIREGMFVKPGMEMMSIGQLEHIWVIGEVFERQAMLVQSGDTVQMSLDYLPGRLWHGSVDYVYPSLNPSTRTAQVRIHFDNSDRYLRPGMFAQMEIASQMDDEVLVIPREALIRTGQQARVVLALGEGRFKSVTVEVGRIGEQQVEIVSGLKEGEKIVTSAQFLIDSESSKTSDFQRLEVRDDTAQLTPSSLWVEATITGVMNEHRMITASHAAIEEWDWPAMEMEFTVAADVEMAPLQVGTQLHMQITRLDGERYQITGTHIMASEPTNQATVKGVIERIGNQQLTIARGPIKKWNRPSATVDFRVQEGVDIGHLTVGDEIRFTFKVEGQTFWLIEIHEGHAHD